LLHLFKLGRVLLDLGQRVGRARLTGRSAGWLGYDGRRLNRGSFGSSADCLASNAWLARCSSACPRLTRSGSPYFCPSLCATRASASAASAEVGPCPIEEVCGCAAAAGALDDAALEVVGGDGGKSEVEAALGTDLVGLDCIIF
jgi:hypothetical protein